MIAIPPQYKMLALGLALVAAFAAGGSAAWKVRSWKADSDIAEQAAQHAATLANIESTASDIRKRAEQAKADADERIQNIIATHEVALRNARHEADSLTRDLAARPARVRVSNCQAIAGGGGMPETSADPSSPAGQATAELDRTVVADLAGIAGDGDEGIIQLNALIDACRVVTGQ